MLPGSVYPRTLRFEIEDASGRVLANGTFTTLDGEGNLQSRLEHTVERLALGGVGAQELRTRLVEVTEDAAADDAKDLLRVATTTSVFVSPGWVSLLPPLVTLVMSAVVGQVRVSIIRFAQRTTMRLNLASFFRSPIGADRVVGRHLVRRDDRRERERVYGLFAHV